MATTKPRITITLEPHIYRSLLRASHANGQPMSEIVANLLAAFQPTLDQMASIFERVQEAEMQRVAQIIEELTDAQATACRVLGLPQGSRHVTIAEGVQPPYLTGGSGAGRRTRKKTAKNAGGSAK